MQTDNIILATSMPIPHSKDFDLRFEMKVRGIVAPSAMSQPSTETKSGLSVLEHALAAYRIVTKHWISDVSRTKRSDKATDFDLPIPVSTEENLHAI